MKASLRLNRRALLDKVCEIYEQNTGIAIDPQELQNAFIQAQSEMRDEALDNYLPESGRPGQDNPGAG